MNKNIIYSGILLSSLGMTTVGLAGKMAEINNSVGVIYKDLIKEELKTCSEKDLCYSKDYFYVNSNGNNSQLEPVLLNVKYFPKKNSFSIGGSNFKCSLSDDSFNENCFSVLENIINYNF